MNVKGYWTGKIDGTNSAGFALKLDQDGETVTGSGRFNEPGLGQYEYLVSGTVDEKIILTLTPGRVIGVIGLGMTTVVGVIEPDGIMRGRWKTDINTEGVFEATRETLPELEAKLPVKKSVFVVHGHDEGAKQSVARFLENLGLKPVILQEQINQGMTVIEKFEKFASRAGFAVVLMTPDDVGYAKGNEQQAKDRPRQNVVLELGYFTALLGREKTYVLLKGDVEVPSDILGLAYEPMDSREGWKIGLSRELKAAGFVINLNDAI